MKRTAAGLVFAAALFSAGATRADWRDLVGSRAPEISAERWLNVPADVKPSRKALQGRLWLLCFLGSVG